MIDSNNLRPCGRNLGFLQAQQIGNIGIVTNFSIPIFLQFHSLFSSCDINLEINWCKNSFLNVADNICIFALWSIAINDRPSGCLSIYTDTNS